MRKWKRERIKRNRRLNSVLVIDKLVDQQISKDHLRVSLEMD